MLKLWYSPGSASMVPHIVLEELGVAYERLTVDREARQHKSPAYLALNPNGLIPVLLDGDLVVYETAAIVMHLADTHPQAGWLPPLGTPERALAYQWLAWCTNALQATLLVYYYPERWVADGNAAAAAEVQARAEARIGGLLDQLDTACARRGGPWFLGERVSVLDAYVFTLCHWTAGWPGAAGTRPALRALLERVMQRPAVQRVLATEGAQPPYF